MMKDEHYQARGMFESVDIGGEWLKIPATVPKLAKTSGKTVWPGPDLGAFNADVYGDLLGLTEAVITELQKSKVI